MREKIYKMVHIYKGNPASNLYKWYMIAMIAMSLLPLTVKKEPDFMGILEIICLVAFVIDYILRWSTADYKFGNHSWKAFVKYPFRLIAIIDIMSIFALVCSVFHLLISVQFAQALAVFRIVRILRYSQNVRRIITILKGSRKPLLAVGSLAVGYILVSAIIIFNVEPDSFQTFFDAVYWATVSLTTVGYGDIYPVTVLGRVVAMISSFFGIAIVALPAGIVTAEYIGSLKEK